MRHPLRPSQLNVQSPAWAFWVNTVAASPFVDWHRRTSIYRRMGIACETHEIYPSCYFHTADIHIAPGAILNHGVHIENVARVEIGRRTGLGIFATVLTSTHEIGPSHERAGAWSYLPVTIGAGCWIGARSTILAGVEIGDGCIVAAGSLVRESCEPDGVYAGVPARRVREL